MCRSPMKALNMGTQAVFCGELSFLMNSPWKGELTFIKVLSSFGLGSKVRKIAFLRGESPR